MEWPLGKSAAVQCSTQHQCLPHWLGGISGGNIKLSSAGWWLPSKQCHINVLKITMVHNALKSFLPLLQGKAVWILCSNIATVAHLNHMEGRSPPMNNVMCAIHQLCESSHIQLMVTYLPGVDNMVADHLSRLWPHQASTSNVLPP